MLFPEPSPFQLTIPPSKLMPPPVPPPLPPLGIHWPLSHLLIITYINSCRIGLMYHPPSVYWKIASREKGAVDYGALSSSDVDSAMHQLS